MSELQDQIDKAQKAISGRPPEMDYLSTDDLLEAANLEHLERGCYCQTENPSIYDLCNACLIQKLSAKVARLKEWQKWARVVFIRHDINEVTPLEFRVPPEARGEDDE